MAQKNHKNGNELLDQFGYNFWYVADLYEKYRSDRNSVSDYWKNYFEELDEQPPAGDIQRAPDKKKQAKPEQPAPDGAVKITGVGAKIIDNMVESLSIPTATSYRTISVKLLEENRRIINQYLKKDNIKISFTHIIAYAIVKALESYPALNNSFLESEGQSYLIPKKEVNLGLAVDIEKKDGSRSLIVPNIKNAGELRFKEFFEKYDDLIRRSRTGKIEPQDFQGTTITLTNPGTVGTVSSIPRLMAGQGTIIAVGVIDYPAEYQATDKNTIAALGIGKIMNITSTYDHRIIQGAESGLFLKKINELLLGEDEFYDNLFADLSLPYHPVNWKEDVSAKGRSAFISSGDNVEKNARILQLINMYRVRGHLLANLNPLGIKNYYHPELDPATYGFTIWDYDRTFITGDLAGIKTCTLREILDVLQQTYCNKIGAEYMHIQNPEEKSWLQDKMEPKRNIPSYNIEVKKRILWKLITAESFEHFLHTKFVGHKRFSLEGSETVLPLLDHLIRLAADDDVSEIFLGMAHRGRLNILANVIGKSYEKIFSEFEGDIDPYSFQGSGDVKYHLGATGFYPITAEKEVRISVAPNPSHLEWVNPVVEGIVRAKQSRSGDTERKQIIPVLIHGDASFAGQGIVSETLNLSQLKGYRTGGTVHLIINNQIGFTTAPEEARSSIYASDVAKMVQAPIFHVNGDDPEASLWIAQIAFEYRQKFNKDVVIDLLGYRRHGHNEADDPAYTQPIMYKKIKNHPSVMEIYRDRLIKEKIITSDEFNEMSESVQECLDEGLTLSRNRKIDFHSETPLAVSEETLNEFYSSELKKPGLVDLRNVIEGITTLPDGFEINPKLKKSLEKRRNVLNNPDELIEWAYAEALAFGTLLMEGHPVRLSGQDSARGTFSQRHLVLTDINTGNEIILHNQIKGITAELEALDSLLSEAAVLGFEFGYSAADPLALVMWEAQFGDFVNAAQVIIDNFIVSGQSKWKLPNNLVLLLPHGFEGQGPEHSSARLERFLILCAEDNMYVCNPSTPSQYYHLLRKQVQDRISKPFIILTPKSLLRHPAARSTLNELINNDFAEVIDDLQTTLKDSIKRVVLVSGKFYYDLLKHRTEKEINDSAIVRLEQYYPFPVEQLKNVFSKYPNAEKIVWAQEEPRNMGAWNFLRHRLEKIMPDGCRLSGVSRKESASPAAGSLKVHLIEQEQLLTDTFSV